MVLLVLDQYTILKKNTPATLNSHFLYELFELKRSAVHNIDIY